MKPAPPVTTYLGMETTNAGYLGQPVCGSPGVIFTAFW
jgi:hypothetical protein